MRAARSTSRSRRSSGTTPTSSSSFRSFCRRPSRTRTPTCRPWVRPRLPPFPRTRLLHGSDVVVHARGLPAMNRNQLPPPSAPATAEHFTVPKRPYGLLRARTHTHDRYAPHRTLIPFPWRLHACVGAAPVALCECASRAAPLLGRPFRAHRCPPARCAFALTGTLRIVLADPTCIGLVAAIRKCAPWRPAGAAASLARRRRPPPSTPTPRYHAR